MSRLLDQLARLFVEPQPTVAPAEHDVHWLPPGDRSPASVPSRVAQRVAVVCAPRDARVAGSAAALALAHAGQASAVVVLDWGSPAGSERPASPAARRCAARLRDIELPATAAGRVVRIALPEDDPEAALVARMVLARVDEPAVLVVAAARGPEIERLLAEQDRILLASRPGADEELTALALAALGELGPCAAVELRASPGAFALARSGTALVAPLRAPFLAALGY